MDRDTFAAQVIDSEHTTNDISPQIVEYQDFPHRISIFVHQGVDWLLCSTISIIGTICVEQVVV